MQPAEAQSARWPRWMLLLVFALTLLVRQGAANVSPLDAAHDPDAYLQLGARLRYAGEFAIQVMPTAYRPPLYPLLVAACYLYYGGPLELLAAAHTVLGAATAALVFLLAERWGLSKRGALIAAGLVAIDPILLNQAVQPMTETLAAFLAALALWSLTCWTVRPTALRAGLPGAVLGLCILCRPTFLLWLALLVAALIVLPGRPALRLTRCAALLLSAGLVLAPWAARNYGVFRRPIVTTTHGGFTLHLANNPHFYEHLVDGGWWKPWDGSIFALQSNIEFSFNGELESDREHYQEAFQTIRNQPGMFLLSCVYRFSRMWGLCPLATTSPESIKHRLARYAVALFYAAEFALAARGAWLVGRRWREAPWLFGLLLVLAFTAAHLFYWTDMRMRAPLTAVIALAAGAAVSGSLNRRGAESSPGGAPVAPVPAS